MNLVVLLLALIASPAKAGSSISGDARSDRTTIVFSTVTMPTVANKTNLSTFTLYNNGINIYGTAAYTVPANKILHLSGFNATLTPVTQVGGQTISSTTITLQTGAGISTATIIEQFTVFWTTGTQNLPYTKIWPEGLEISSTTVFAVAHLDWANGFVINWNLDGFLR